VRPSLPTYNPEEKKVILGFIQYLDYDEIQVIANFSEISIT
jgi:hypothetical protein